MKRKSFWKTAFGFSFLSLALTACGGVTPVSGPSDTRQTQGTEQTQASQQTQETGQTEQTGASQETKDYETEIKKVYGLYLQNGGTQTYEEWLASIKGADGVGIVSIEKTGSDGQTDTYTITLSNGTTTQISIKNGKEAYSCTVLPSEHGYISVNVGSAFVGDDITFLVHPEEGYSIAHLYLNEVDAAPQMTDPLSYTTKMVKNGFVVRAEFEINRRVSAEVFKREITDMGLLTDEKGFTMEYTTGVQGSGYHSEGLVKIQKSGKYIKYASGSSYETLLVEDDGGTYTAYSRSTNGEDEWGSWSKAATDIKFDTVWDQLIPGFTTLAKFDYTYNPKSGYYEAEMEEVPAGVIPGSYSTSNFQVQLGFKGDRCSEFYITFDQGDSRYSYHIDVKGTAYDYDGKTVIDPEWVEKVIAEANLLEIELTASTVEEANLVSSLLEDYKKENPEDTFRFTVSINDSPSLNSQGDIFWFAQDQLNRYLSNDVLSPLDNEAKATVTANNVASSVSAVTVGGKVYAYPMTADNGYFLYYNKSVVSADHVNDLETILDDCSMRGRYFGMELTSAWYDVAFFFGTGCHSIWNLDADGNFESCDDSFYSPEGLAALKAISMLKNSSAYVNVSSFDRGYDLGALVSGTWEYSNAKRIFGDNLGCAALPNFTVDGKTYHMGSFFGCKYLGVRKQSDSAKEALCHRLANYLTSYKAQLKRLEELGFGPSNIEASKSSLAKENPALQALYQQLEYATSQGQYPGSWWDIALNPVRQVRYYYTEEEMKDLLEDYNEAINAIAPNVNPTPTFPSGGGQQIDPEEPEPEEPEPEEPETVLYTITGLPNWIANDGAAVFAWAWGGEAEKWVRVQLGTPGTGGPDDKELTATVELLSTRIGFNLARCAAGTKAPDWTVDDDSAGRVYNKTGDIDIEPGETIYTSPKWTEYKPTIIS